MSQLAADNQLVEQVCHNDLLSVQDTQRQADGQEKEGIPEKAKCQEDL